MAASAPSPTALLSERFNPEQQRLLLELLRSGVSGNDVVSVLQSGTDDHVTALLEDALAVQRGTQVVLSGGCGSKRKWNGNYAEITKYPRSGAWMAVRVEGEANDLKWRKTGFRKVPGGASCLLRLNPDLLTRVLSFLGGKKTTSEGSGDGDRHMISVRDAGRVHTQIALVCRELRLFCNNNLRNFIGRIDANMLCLQQPQIVPCILWMCRYEVSLGAFKIQAEVADVPMLRMLLRECDTASLTEVKARIGSIWQSDVRGRSVIIEQAWTGRSPYYSQSTHGFMARQLGVPFVENPLEETPCRKHLHDTIAEEHPNLVQLDVDCRWLPINSDYSSTKYTYRDWKRAEVSSSLFSLPHVQKLKIAFSNFGQVAMIRFNYCNFITSFIKKLPCLEELHLAASSIGQALRATRLHIESETLRHLNVESLGEIVWVSCKCPRLERFVCNGNRNGNGTRPDLTLDQLRALGGSGSGVFPGTTPMLGMEVPDTCVFVLKDFDLERDWSHSARAARYFGFAGYTSDEDE